MRQFYLTFPNGHALRGELRSELQKEYDVLGVTIDENDNI